MLGPIRNAARRTGGRILSTGKFEPVMNFTSSTLHIKNQFERNCKQFLEKEFEAAFKQTQEKSRGQFIGLGNKTGGELGANSVELGGQGSLLTESINAIDGILLNSHRATIENALRITTRLVCETAGIPQNIKQVVLGMIDAKAADSNTSVQVISQIVQSIGRQQLGANFAKFIQNNPLNLSDNPLLEPNPDISGTLEFNWSPQLLDALQKDEKRINELGNIVFKKIEKLCKDFESRLETEANTKWDKSLGVIENFNLVDSGGAFHNTNSSNNNFLQQQIPQSELYEIAKSLFELPL